jgi:hypothetical protein
MLVGAVHKTKESREILLSMQRNPHWQGCIPEWGPDNLKGEPDLNTLNPLRARAYTLRARAYTNNGRCTKMVISKWFGPPAPGSRYTSNCTS